MAKNFDINSENDGFEVAVLETDEILAYNTIIYPIQINVSCK